MKRFELTHSVKSPHFIGSWIIEPPRLCENIIEFFESKSKEHVPGITTSGGAFEQKRTTDLGILPRDIDKDDHFPIREYLQKLMDCYRDYAEQWSFIKEKMPQLDLGPFNIQRYQKGDHFQGVHTERTDFSSSNRALAWMTYLNDVEEGGATSFVHFDLEVQPKAGQTLIWPVDWTHAHCGNIVTHGSKYIITGWLLFPVSM